jgi:hypothetical protein
MGELKLIEGDLAPEVTKLKPEDAPSRSTSRPKPRIGGSH